MKAGTVFWIVAACLQLAFDVWVVTERFKGPKQPPETRYVTQPYLGAVFRSQPSNGTVEVFNARTHEWVPLGRPGVLPPENDPVAWGATPVK